MVRRILQLEYFAMLLFSLYLYARLAGNWIVFLSVFFLIDLSMSGYLKNKNLGALLYNAVHNYFLAFLLIFLGTYTQNILLMQIGTILLFHVSIDRLLGYGLKYPKDFKDSHMQKV